jgi:hypothetical protein
VKFLVAFSPLFPIIRVLWFSENRQTVFCIVLNQLFENSQNTEQQLEGIGEY